MRVRTFAAAVLSLSFAATLPGSSADAGQRERTAGSTSIDWPHFRFDKNHTGYQPFETSLSPDNIGSAGLLWEDSLGGSDSFVYFSSPTVVNGVLYVGTDDGHLFAYSADGCGGEFCTTPLWQSTYIPQMIDSPAAADGIVYIGSQPDNTSAAGKLNAFAVDGCGQSVCAPLWQGDAGPDAIIDSSPAVWKHLVFVGAKDLYTFNAGGCGKPHCKPVWTGKLGDQSESSPVIYKGVVYIGDSDGKLYAFKATGCGARVCNPLWTADYAGSSFDYGSSPSVSDGVVYIASFDRLSAFDANGCGKARCKPLWQGVPKFGEGDGYIFGGSPTIANGVVYAGRNTGEVLAWAESCKQETCSPLWVGLTAAGQIVNASPTVVNGKVYIGSSDSSEDGILYVYGLPH